MVNGNLLRYDNYKNNDRIHKRCRGHKQVFMHLKQLLKCQNLILRCSFYRVRATINMSQIV